MAKKNNPEQSKSQHDKGQREAEQKARTHHEWRQNNRPIGRSSNNR